MSWIHCRSHITIVAISASWVRITSAAINSSTNLVYIIESTVVRFRHHLLFSAFTLLKTFEQKFFFASFSTIRFYTNQFWFFFNNSTVDKLFFVASFSVTHLFQSRIDKLFLVHVIFDFASVINKQIFVHIWFFSLFLSSIFSFWLTNTLI